MNKANYIESSSLKSKKTNDVNKRKRIDEGEVSDSMYLNIYYLLYVKKNNG